MCEAMLRNEEEDLMEMMHVLNAYSAPFTSCMCLIRILYELRSCESDDGGVGGWEGELDVGEGVLCIILHFFSL